MVIGELSKVDTTFSRREVYPATPLGIPLVVVYPFKEGVAYTGLPIAA